MFDLEDENTWFVGSYCSNCLRKCGHGSAEINECASKLIPNKWKALKLVNLKVEKKVLTDQIIQTD